MGTLIEIVQFSSTEPFTILYIEHCPLLFMSSCLHSSGVAVMNEVRRMMGPRPLEQRQRTVSLSFNPNAITERRSRNSKPKGKKLSRTVMQNLSVTKYNESSP